MSDGSSVSVSAGDIRVFYVPRCGWSARALGYHDGIGPYFSLPEALRRAEEIIGESAWKPDRVSITHLPALAAVDPADVIVAPGSTRVEDSYSSVPAAVLPPSPQEQTKPKNQVHCLKTWPPYFAAVRSGIKRFELRADDRDFRVGDCLVLQEFDPERRTYTGEMVSVRVLYLTRDFLPSGWVALSIVPWVSGLLPPSQE